MSPKWFNHPSVGNFTSFWVGLKFLNFFICIALKPKACIGGFGCEVYLSINRCEKICINAISMHENFDHLWLSSSSHWPLQNKFNDSNPFEQNHVEVLCKIEDRSDTSSSPPINVSAIIKGFVLHVECIHCPHKSGTP